MGVPQAIHTLGKAACAAKRIPEETLMALTREVLEISNLKPESVKSKIASIRAEKSNTVAFRMTDGTEVVKHWTDRSRNDSWTPEMRKQAGEYAKQARGKKK